MSLPLPALPPGIALRKAGRGEEEALRALVRAAYGRYVARIGREPAPMSDDYAARISAGEAYVLEGQGGILALIVLEDQPDALLIDNVAVAPARQGQGLGRWLCAFAEAEATRRGRPRLRLYTHALMTENQELYRRLGFRETRRVRECGFDRIYMEKPLCAPC